MERGKSKERRWMANGTGSLFMDGANKNNDSPLTNKNSFLPIVKYVHDI